MGDAVVKAKTLEERITERLHESIGDLITADDLKAMVERGVEKALFHERPGEQRDRWDRPPPRPPLVDELVAKFLLERMNAAVSDWIAAHPDLMQKAVDDAIAGGVGRALLRAMDARLGFIFEDAVETMRAQNLLRSS